MRFLPAGWAALLFLLLGACATPQTDFVLQNKDRFPAKTEIAGVPFFPQEKYYCGPAALATVLAWSGLPVTQREIGPQVYTPGKEGSLRADVLTAARRNGRLAVPVSSLAALLAEIAEGRPVLVFQNLAFDWYPQWHYAVAFGYDLDAGTLLLRSGLDARHQIDLAAFERTWRRGDRWALVVLTPDRLPASANEKMVLEAAVGLTRVERHAEAAVAFDAVARRWPESFAAHMGSGNARYATQDYRRAERAFRAAIARTPNAAAAWNNLAYVLAKLGRRQEAIAAARKAVRYGGPHAAAYRDTLRDVSAGAL